VFALLRAMQRRTPVTTHKTTELTVEAAFLNSIEAARFLGLSPRTLDRWRWAGFGPRFRRHGGRVVYAVADLLAWSEAQARTSTRDRAPEAPA
jgi:hypothetical protein